MARYLRFSRYFWFWSKRQTFLTTLVVKTSQTKRKRPEKRFCKEQFIPQRHFKKNWREGAHFWGGDGWCPFCSPELLRQVPSTWLIVLRCWRPGGKVFSPKFLTGQGFARGLHAEILAQTSKINTEQESDEMPEITFTLGALNDMWLKKFFVVC